MTHIACIQSLRIKRRLLHLLVAVVLSGFFLPVHAEERSVLKVCADPYFPPFSTKKTDGFENKIAALLAKDLGLPVEYTWFPQRMGFIRNTLRAEREDGRGYKCDLVMGLPDEYELAITTDPYYRSTYALVFLDNSKLNKIQTAEDLLNLDKTERDKLRIGMTERSPGGRWMAKYQMHEQIAPYIAQSGDPNEYPGEPMLNDINAGKIDAAIIWGPTAGLFKQLQPRIRVIPLKSEPGVKFDFAISAGVRFGDKEWKNEVDKLLKQNSEEITRLLHEYRIPLVDDKGALLK